MEDTSRTADQPRARRAGAATAMVHLYRGELGRLTSLNGRIDATTRGATAFVGAVAGIGLGTDAISHAVFLVGMVLTLYFLVLEAQRFRQHEVSRARVELLERGYFSDVLTGDTAWPWVGPLLDRLNNPKPPLDVWAAMGWRLRRNYLWIYLAALVTWLFKLDLTGGPPDSLGALLARAGVGLLSGWMVMAVVLVFYAGLVALAVSAAWRYPEGGS